MTQDPIQPLADIGRRVLQTVRYLAMPPVPDQPLESYESQVRDPVVALSGICNELLERLTAAPAATEPESLPNEPVSRFVPAPNPASAFPTFSRTDSAATSISANWRDEAADLQRENQATERPDITVFTGTSPSEEPRRSIDDPGPSPDELDESAPQTNSPETPRRPAIDGSDLSLADRQTAGRAPRSRNVQHRVASEASQEERSETRSFARQERPEARQTEWPSDARASDVPSRAENGSVREAGESDVPLHGSRLTGSTERLAAMLRSHVAEPVTRTAEEESQEGEDAFSSRQGDDERGNVERTRPAGRADIEEIMERLADELETEFVRTYGSSGG